MSKSPKNIVQPSISHVFRGGLSTTIVIFSYFDGEIKVLLHKKTEEPIEGELGHLGRLLLSNEDTDKALDKVLMNNVGFNDFYKKQLSAFAKVDRHSLGRVVTLAYYGLIPWDRAEKINSENLVWYNLKDVPNLCYDHNAILKKVTKRLRKGLLRHPIVFELLPKAFILSDVIKIYELAFETKVDVPNFRKRILKSELIRGTGKFLIKENQQGRKPELYTFNKKKYKQIKEIVQFNF